VSCIGTGLVEPTRDIPFQGSYGVCRLLDEYKDDPLAQSIRGKRFIRDLEPAEGTRWLLDRFNEGRVSYRDLEQQFHCSWKHLPRNFEAIGVAWSPVPRRAGMVATPISGDLVDAVQALREDSRLFLGSAGAAGVLRSRGITCTDGEVRRIYDEHPRFKTFTVKPREMHVHRMVAKMKGYAYHTDLKYFHHLTAEPTDTYDYEIAFVDDRTRFVPWFELLPDRRAATVARSLGNFLEVIAPHRPYELIVDNGSEFRGVFAQALETMQIKPHYVPPHSPWVNGKIERLWRTTNEGLIPPALRHVDRGAPSWDDIANVMRVYNDEKPHRSLRELYRKETTPRQAWDSEAHWGPSDGQVGYSEWQVPLPGSGGRQRPVVQGSSDEE
jgi:transposase InsO family protein